MNNIDTVWRIVMNYMDDESLIGGKYYSLDEADSVARWLNGEHERLNTNRRFRVTQMYEHKV